ncbi:hypothetical protein QBC37DRAFT_448497 [Rhypophila decipiens]|uniref:NmrA-like domain-containing protein n=1 Tax=Rhypophila decipiens TaxID=261697 RepID=A0AAN6Y1H2_9PEZI|nr:hypothetical protein QBC37DRAFT_448497 [Rhypophila decipiens]
MSTQTTNMKKIFIIGGTGAQGLPIVQALTQSGTYSVRILTRDPSSPRAQSLLSSASSPELVELFPGSFTSESDVRAGMANCWGAFVNIDGFATGEALEIFYTMRCYELAIEQGLEMYIHGNIDFGYKVSGYQSQFRCGHYDGKGRAGEWILMSNEAAKTESQRMKAALFTTGPYIDMALSPMTPLAPMIEKDDETGEEVVTWRLPLTENGAMPHVVLDDCGHYVKWLFDHHSEDRVDGMDLRVAMGHVRYDDMAAAFAKVTGHKARFVDVSEEEYWSPNGYWGSIASQPCGYMHAHAGAGEGNIPDGVMTIKQNFTGWWRTYQNCGEPSSRDAVAKHIGLKRDYALLDEIHPGRIRTPEEFFRREDEKARTEGRGSLWNVVVNEPRHVLKIHEDQSIFRSMKKDDA